MSTASNEVLALYNAGPRFDTTLVNSITRNMRMYITSSFCFVHKTHTAGSVAYFGYLYFRFWRPHCRFRLSVVVVVDSTELRPRMAVDKSEQQNVNNVIQDFRFLLRNREAPEAR